MLRLGCFKFESGRLYFHKLHPEELEEFRGVDSGSKLDHCPHKPCLNENNRNNWFGFCGARGLTWITQIVFSV